MDNTRNTKVYRKLGGDEEVIASGGKITVETGGLIDASAAAGSIVFAAGEVDTADLATNAVTTTKITDLNVTTGKIAAGAVTFAKAKVFVSAEQTGTGIAQNIAHGLAVVPAAVLIVPTDTAPATVGAYTVTEGVHDATNVIVTATNGKKYKVMAWA